MRLKLLEESHFQKLATTAANTYLEKNLFKKNKVNVPLVIAVFGIILFITFVLFVR